MSALHFGDRPMLIGGEMTFVEGGELITCLNPSKE